MKTLRIVTPLFLASLFSLIFISCEDESVPLKVQFNMENNVYFVGDTVRVFDQTTGGTGTYEYLWNFGNETTSTEKDPFVIYSENGGYVITLKVTDGSGKSLSAQKMVTIEPAIVENVGNLDLLWTGVLAGEVRSSTPALSNDGFVYMTANDHYLRKFNATTGQQVWAFNLRGSADGAIPAGNTHTTPTIDDNGSVYVGTGLTSGSIARVYAVNPDGTKKWVVAGDANTGFWNQGNPSTPRIDYIMFPFDENCVYIGNRGGTGSVIAVNKSTGLRIGYLTSTSGTGGPAGGVTAGTILTKNKKLIWTGGTNGVFGASAIDLSTSAASGTPFLWDIYGSSDVDASLSLNANGSMAVDAQSNVYMLGTFSTQGGSVVSFTDDGVKRWLTPLGDIGDLDQGGIVIAADGTIIATVKRTIGEANGGIIALNPTTGDIKWSFKVPEDVSGVAAVDAAGRVHFGTQSGNYYIVNPSQLDSPVVKKDIAELIAESGDTNWEAGGARIWSSPTIGDDGVMYIGVTNIDNPVKSAIVAIKNAGTTGPANSPWPMKGQNRRNTNIQP